MYILSIPLIPTFCKYYLLFIIIKIFVHNSLTNNYFFDIIMMYEATKIL